MKGVAEARQEGRAGRPPLALHQQHPGLGFPRGFGQSLRGSLPPYTVSQLTHGYRRIREELAGYTPRRAQEGGSTGSAAGSQVGQQQPQPMATGTAASEDGSTSQTGPY